jgi:dihydroorotase
VGPPAESESQVIERDIAVAEETSGRLHVQHVSTRLGVELIAQAKDRRIPVTAEVTPHHLTLTVDSLETPDTNLKMYPPLREEADRLALVDGLREGVIDAVATDHAPHSKEEKAVGFGDAPRGVIGLETALPLALDALEGDLLLLFERMSVAPARIAGLGAQGRSVEPGAPASLVLIDPGVQWTPTRFASKSSNSPFIGRKLRGKVVLTVHGGKIAYQAEAPSA